MVDRRALGPAIVTTLALLLVVTAVIWSAGGDPLALARLGTRFSQAESEGTEGYDGQFVYYIARDPRPQAVAPYLDVPAYRYQRILLPLVSRLAVFGQEAAIPWALAVVSILSHGLGTWAMASLLLDRSQRVWYALIYGLWVGFVLAVRLDLPEPLAYALVATAILAGARGRLRLSWVLFGLALFAKEVTALFVLARWLYDAFHRRWRSVFGLTLVAIVPFMIFQIWLWAQFGSPGIGSGGAGATPFEWLPLAGFLRVAQVDPLVFAVYLVVFGPPVILPALWGVWQGFRGLRSARLDEMTLALAIHGLAVVWLPFSTFREPGGLLRFASGLVLAFILVAAGLNRTRLLNYAYFSIALNVFLIE